MFHNPLQLLQQIPKLLNKPRRPDPARVATAVPLHVMRQRHIVVIGDGGIRGGLEDLARNGLGRLTVVDHDEVSPTNVWSQATRLSDIGKAKVVALGEALRDINPDIDYRGVQRNFLEMTESDISNLVSDADLLLFMTDCFHAQARGNLVSLKHGKPALFAIVYTGGGVLEVTWNCPGVTPACHRCITAGRYQAYDAGFTDEIGSTGTTIFASHYLNCVIGHLSLSFLLRGTDSRFGNLVDRAGERNFLQLRLHPDFVVQTVDGPKDVFKRYLGDNRHTFCFDSIWLPPDDPPRYKVCPDCKSTGDLRDAKGRIQGTVPTHDSGRPMFSPKAQPAQSSPFSLVRTREKPTIRIPSDVYSDIERIIGQQPAETGGMLIGTWKEPFNILHFHYDPSGSTGSAMYDPDFRALNHALKTMYEPKGWDMVGFVHSHPLGIRRPSGDWGGNIGDMAYAAANLKANPGLPAFLMPIAMTIPNSGSFELIPFVVFADRISEAVEARIEITNPIRQNHPCNNDFNTNLSTRQLERYNRQPKSSI